MHFIEGQFYHIYNKGNNSQKIFYERDNYIFSLRKIRTHLCPHVDVLSYCLMPNHFHFLVYVPVEPSQNEPQIHVANFEKTYTLAELRATEERGLEENPINKSIRDGIAVILRSYTRAMNKRYKRPGSLFQQKTKAKDLSQKDINYPFVCFHYIHQNPIKSKLVKNPGDWEFSSYRDHAGMRNGILCNLQVASELLDIPLDHDQFMKQSMGVKVFEEYQVDFMSK